MLHFLKTMDFEVKPLVKYNNIMAAIMLVSANHPKKAIDNENKSIYDSMNIVYP